MNLSSENLTWLIENFEHTKNDDMATKLNISHSALHRLARQYNLKKTPEFQASCQANATKYARAANRRNNWPPKGYIIPGSEIYRFQKGITPTERMGEERNKQRIERAATSRRTTVKGERARITFGIDQRTKLRLVKVPHAKNAFRHILKKRGYIVHRASKVIFYNEATDRSTKAEQTARNKYRFEIQQIEVA